MKKEVFEFTEIFQKNFWDTKNPNGFFRVIKKEFKYIGLLFLLTLITFKIAFYKESIVVLLRSVLSLFWLFVLPGYFIMLYWKEELRFAERFIIGLVASAAIIGIFSYYLGLVGLHIKYHPLLLPVALIILGILFSMKRYNKNNQ